MPLELVQTNVPRPIRRPKGANILMTNQSAIDVYFSNDYNVLAITAPGAVPNGVKLSANGGQLTWNAWPGVVYFRSVSDTLIGVEP
jgi:hypothetical protein